MLTERLRSSAAGDGRAISFAFSAGIAFAVMLLLAGALRGAIAFSVRFGDEPLPGVDTLRLVPAMSGVLLGSLGLPTVAACIGTLSWLVLRTGLLSRWIGWLGLAVAVGLLGAVAIGPWLLPLVLVWALSMSVALWRGRRGDATRPSGPHVSVSPP